MTSTEEGPGGGGGWRLQPFASFRERGYPWLWAANVTHGAFQTTQGFAIVWLTIEMLDGDGFRLGLVEFAMALPILLFGLLAGRLADRRDQRLLLMTSHIVVALFLLLTALLVAANVLSLGLVFVLAFLAAAGSAFGEPVRLALIPALVPKPESTDRSLMGRDAGLAESSAAGWRSPGGAGSGPERGAVAQRSSGALRARARGCARRARACWREPRSRAGAVSGRQAGSGSARSRARAAAHWPAQGQRFGRCRVQRRAEWVSRPARAK